MSTYAQHDAPRSTEALVEQLQKHLETNVVEAFQAQGDPLFEANLVEDLNKHDGGPLHLRRRGPPRGEGGGGWCWRASLRGWAKAIGEADLLDTRKHDGGWNQLQTLLKFLRMLDDENLTEERGVQRVLRE